MERIEDLNRFPHIWMVADRIEGWLHQNQGRLLYEAAAAVEPPASIVEIGSHHGKSTVVLASAKSPQVRLMAVDPFDDPRWGGGSAAFDVFLHNLNAAGVRSDVECFRGLSVDAAQAWQRGPVGLLWIDGAHDVRSVLADIDGWMPHVANGGLIYVHDAYSAIGTTQAVLRRFLGSRHLHYIGADRSLMMFRKEDVSLSARSRDAARLLARLHYFGRNVCVKFAHRHHWDWLPPLVGSHSDDSLF
jgi:predicted O-methyltransferase YrrM